MAPPDPGTAGVTGPPPEPYVSLVVTTRNDDHGGDPLTRLQAFVNTFAAQCARTGLMAEVIVVEWNPPDGRPRVSELLRMPAGAPFPVRVVEVPAAIHETFRHAAVLPLFQMIAKNVGIRRARGRFVLATNIDIIFSTELVEHLASGQLEAGDLYRVDRHDIEAAFPVDAPLDEQMAYCQTHQIRLHARSGSHAVDSHGHVRWLDADVAGSAAIRLGEGWHAREGNASSGFRRWVSPEAHLSIDRTVDPDLAHGVALYVDVGPNPYQPDAWVDVEIVAGERRLAQRRLTRRTCFRVRLDDEVRHELTIRTDSIGGREWLPVFERRDQLSCLVHHVAVRPLPRHDYDVGLWRRPPNYHPELRLQPARSGLDVTTDADPYSYCARYAAFEAPASGTYEFALECTLIEGHCSLAMMDDEHGRWLPSTVVEAVDDDIHVFDLVVELERGTRCSLFLSNDRPHGGCSRLLLRRLRASVPAETLVRGTDHPRDASTTVTSRLSKGRRRARLRRLLGRRLRGILGPLTVLGLQRADGRQDASDRVRELEAQVTSLAPLADLAPLARLLRAHRPAIYQNAAGDFQLMARDRWFAFRGYPELEMFSMNVDGLFEAIALAAGMREQVWSMPLCAFHLEHETGSGWTPEGEALLKARIAESGVTWLDAGTVQVLSTYMAWFRRPMIFNGSDWGLGDVVLQERTLRAPPVTADSAPP